MSEQPPSIPPAEQPQQAADTSLEEGTLVPQEVSNQGRQLVFS